MSRKSEQSALSNCGKNTLGTLSVKLNASFVIFVLHIYCYQV